MKKLSAIVFLLSIAATGFTQNSAYVTIQGKSDLTISKHIYGHFSEHLGRCIYDGFWIDSS